MSTMLVIGLGHAIFPIVGGMLMKKVGLALGTVVGVLIAVFLGNSRFLTVDLIGIGVGIAIGLIMQKEDKKE